jgi:hypothetical protein
VPLQDSTQAVSKYSPQNFTIISSFQCSCYMSRQWKNTSPRLATCSLEIYDLIFIRRFARNGHLQAKCQHHNTDCYCHHSDWRFWTFWMVVNALTLNEVWNNIETCAEYTIRSLYQGQSIFKYTLRQSDTQCTSQCYRTQLHHYYCNNSGLITNKIKCLVPQFSRLAS